MKAFLICGTVGSVVFVAMGMQLGIFGNHRHSSAAAPEVVEVEKAPAKPRAQFPEELAPAAQGAPVDAAAAFEPGDRPHPMVFLKSSGEIHRWHEDHAGYHEDWWTTIVEKTELIVVLGNARKIALDTTNYPNGAPPITRYRHDLEAALVEAKTGQILAHRLFQNMPRQVRRTEPWERTALGAEVSYHTVFRWAAGIAKSGPPAEPHQPPFITIVKD